MVNNTPDTPSCDYLAMSPYWCMVETMLEGAQAMRAAGKAYLPQFPNETETNYEYRRKNAKFTNVFRDLVEGLAAKPFAKQVDLVEKSASPAIKSFVEDVDGAGNHLHVFAGDVFFNGIASAIDWMLVDHTAVPTGISATDERRMGARPYWVRIPATRMKWVESAMIEGKEQFVYAAIHEPTTVRKGFDEVTIDRMRLLIRDRADDGSYGPARFEIWEATAAKVGSKSTSVNWVMKENGPISIGVIALVPFMTGRRKEGTWQLLPPMKDAAYLQVEHYQQETNLKSAKELTAFPMLAGNGISPPLDSNGQPVIAPIGPSVVLYAPMGGQGQQHGEWKFIEPTAASLKFLAEEVDKTEQQLRELGRQPLTAQTGNLTVVTTAFAAQKGNSAVQAWALNLKDALEQALRFTCLWLKDATQPEVTVYTDFDVETDSVEGMKVVLDMKKESLISRVAAINEAKRRNILAPEYDEAEDLELILSEIPGEDGEDDIAGSVTPPANAA
ncbi:DUF4055 domain-containing protein [Phyllobacterium sp. 21LDTY02-6]|uniref:DUF4055 domain-containing protein n=1 Tax=Phyllobacterium sp. 21LDTY02-6 TaxID=2944903 RepID=UPI002021135F|nr:DUF4055 domain-containing protein [Phyllobacterium sp. 21LDTY02-6]MCO4316333.1 DUF4055 domain-containing protein [Phyllobacterium sp. 21LDTY02-6]